MARESVYIAAFNIATLSIKPFLIELSPFHSKYSSVSTFHIDGRMKKSLILREFVPTNTLIYVHQEDTKHNKRLVAFYSQKEACT